MLIGVQYAIGQIHQRIGEESAVGGDWRRTGKYSQTMRSGYYLLQRSF